MSKGVRIALIVLTAGVLSACGGDDRAADTDHELLHVSYDIAREIFRNINDAFIPYYEEQTGLRVSVEQSHAGSSRQARAVAAGLEADVVSMNQFLDIQLLHDATVDQPGGPIIPADWYTRYPNNSSPYSSTMAFVVRTGNPKEIHDWDDLIREDVQIVAPNYKTTGNGRFSYLTAWAFGLERYADWRAEEEGRDPEELSTAEREEAAAQFVQQILANTRVLAPGGRAATTAFVENNQGDVLLTFESEVNLIVQDLGPDRFEVVVPSYGIDAVMYVVAVDAYAKEKGNLQVARDYWDFIYTERGQEIVAESYYRPYNQEVAARYADLLPELDLFDVEDVFGGWAQANQDHFVDGGSFDRLMQGLGRN
ncbi:sulfate ABC transporter substrate-binding protein [Spirochaeta africana]|uniref:Sulfate/thiosulfate-binding protein n=1 Tax=Spirochaeta africana (strain ATCC 700263 / DSM 8902 / Z-7692) TaxID=889378 RepID=H9ULT2_SPIAZ|nr:sulfate ABC transporter substrate-binding protein [Spirochaeta africana]AFG38475.1 sulfate/thiosulfate-binding protein [Spirochaeta africana DSM 8902]